jgi:hypothetical protein
VTPEDRKRADRAWEEMRRSHMRQARLRVREAELELASIRAQIDHARAEVAVAEEYDRGRRAACVAMSLTVDDPSERAEYAREAVEKRERRYCMLPHLEKQLAPVEARLAEYRGKLAKMLAEQRADRAFRRAMRAAYGARAEGRTA